MGRFCFLCARIRPNEAFGGKGERGRICRRCRSLPREKQEALKHEHEILGFLAQFHVSNKNIARLRTLEQSVNSQTAHLATLVLDVALFAPYRRRRTPVQLCRTAFSIAVERAVKHARRLGCRLRVLPERSSKDDERRIAQYYQELRKQGSPFDAATSNRYAPLSAAECAETLMELRFKSKSSPMAQIAALYLWPILWERYRPGLSRWVPGSFDIRWTTCHRDLGI